MEEKIRAVGGTLPPLSCTPQTGSNSWDCLRLDVEEAQGGRVNLLGGVELFSGATSAKVWR